MKGILCNIHGTIVHKTIVNLFMIGNVVVVVVVEYILDLFTVGCMT